jgi:microcystin-dependent protein
MKRTSRFLLGALCAGLLLLPAVPAWAQSNAKPPTQMTYQGFLTDGNGLPFGNSAPVNKTVIFRIYDSLTGGTLKWSSQQVVTVDKGYFSVLLGQGSAVGSEPFNADLTGVFTGAGASDRYLELNADGTTIAPRLRFLPAPSAMLSKSATELLDPSSGTAALSVNNGNVTAVGTLTAANLTTTGNLNASGAVSAVSVNGFGTVPLGGIIMWSGSAVAVPSGWALCDGRTSNSRTTPDLRGRFIVGAGSGAVGLTSRNVGATGGNEQTTLTVGQLPSHNHTVSGNTTEAGSHTHTARAPNNDVNSSGSQGFPFGNNHQAFRSSDRGRDYAISSAAIDSAGNHTHSFNVTSGNTGNGEAFGNLPPFYALAFIMRVQ